MTQKTISIILALVMILGVFTACDGREVENKTDVDLTEADYSFWEAKNEVRLTLPIISETAEQDHSGVTYDDTAEIPKKYQKQIEILKEAMISYFKEGYGIDISKKLNNQKFRIFMVEKGSDNEGTMGYVDQEDRSCLNLNKAIFNEYKERFNNTYVHETLHWLGFISTEYSMVDEGIVDALTESILINANIESFATETYYDARCLAYQMLAADQSIPSLYLENENPNILKHIDNVLKGVSRPFESPKETGERLATLIGGLTYGMYSETIEPYYVAFEAQEIVRAYCQQFSPDNSTIDYIRSFYIVEDYEQVTIQESMQGYQYQFE